jgi:hypothetical protein
MLDLNDAFALRDKLKDQLSIVENYIAVAKAHGGNGNLATTLPPPQYDDRNLEDHPGQEYGGVGKAVRKAITYMPDTFTIRDLMDHIKKHGPLLSVVQVSTVLNRMVRKDNSMIHERGKGSRATIFKKPAPQVL